MVDVVPRVATFGKLRGVALISVEESSYIGGLILAEESSHLELYTKISWDGYVNLVHYE